MHLVKFPLERESDLKFYNDDDGDCRQAEHRDGCICCYVHKKFEVSGDFHLKLDFQFVFSQHRYLVCIQHFLYLLFNVNVCFMIYFCDILI